MYKAWQAKIQSVHLSQTETASLSPNIMILLTVPVKQECHLAKSDFICFIHTSSCSSYFLLFIIRSLYSFCALSCSFNSHTGAIIKFITSVCWTNASELCFSVIKKRKAWLKLRRRTHLCLWRRCSLANYIATNELSIIWMHCLRLSEGPIKSSQLKVWNETGGGGEHVLPLLLNSWLPIKRKQFVVL